MFKFNKEEGYFLHTSVSDFNLLLLTAILNYKTYGEVDYRILYENNVSLWYLTKNGRRQAEILGKKNLIGDKLFFKIISDSEKLNKLLKSYVIPKLDDSNILKEWKRYLEIMDEFCRLYRFYEQPFQQHLEKIILKHVSEDNLVKILSGHQKRSIEEIKNAEAKIALEKLMKLGKIKLELHTNGENIFTNDLKKFTTYAANINNLLKNEVEFLTVDEFQRLLNGKKIDVTLIKNRVTGCAIVKRNGKWKVDAGKKYLYWKNKIMGNQNKEIKGMVAYPGKVIGRAVLHQSWTGVTELSNGDVLVTGMTNPQMMPFIKRVSAIVTDEGGITCHAAIISREMKKPCITGTKNATQLLKTGDLVEVDANKGVVKMLKKK